MRTLDRAEYLQARIEELEEERAAFEPSSNGHPRVEEQERERQDVEVTRTQAEKALADARFVEPTMLAARAAVLQPVLSAAAQDPSVLINAYVRRFGNLVDRILLQETAEAMIDAGVGARVLGTMAARNLEPRTPGGRTGGIRVSGCCRGCDPCAAP
jgi:hypothetical protein